MEHVPLHSINCGLTHSATQRYIRNRSIWVFAKSMFQALFPTVAINLIPLLCLREYRSHLSNSVIQTVLDLSYHTQTHMSVTWGCFHMCLLHLSICIFPPHMPRCLSEQQHVYQIVGSRTGQASVPYIIQGYFRRLCTNIITVCIHVQISENATGHSLTYAYTHTSHEHETTCSIYIFKQKDSILVYDVNTGMQRQV